ncbi:MAG: T9SS type A sorting domain-containing protein [Cryomorphaceae bacterium]
MNYKSLCSLLVIGMLSLSGYAQSVITIDTTQQYQTIDGWEAVANSMEAKSVRDSILPYLDELIDLAVNDVGITRLRFSYKSGMEDTVNYFQQAIDGDIEYDEFTQHRYAKFNDNDDPFVVDPSKFQFAGLDDNITNVILPFKNAVEANGDRFYYNLCYVDFGDQSDFNHIDDPEEYAEYLTYAWSYIDENYGFVPDGLEIILEPDNAAIWNANVIPPVIAAVGQRMDALGYDPEIIAPSLKSLLGIPNYFNAIANNPVALSYLDVLSYHRYGGNTNLVAQQELVDIAEANNLKTAMLEYDYNGNVDNLHYDLKYNNVVAWTKYALMYKSDQKFAYVFVDGTDPENPQFGVCKQTKYLRQYFKFIRPGAIRIQADVTDGEIDPVAFVNLDGSQVVVVKAEAGDSVVVNGLNPGTYNIKYTLGNYDWGNVNPTTYDFDLPAQSIAEGEAVAFDMPAKGVATIYGSPILTSTAERGAAPVFKVYPNPTQSTVLIEGDFSESKTFQITSITGALLSEGILNSNRQFVDLSNFPAGVYILNIDSHTIKVVKE